MTRGWEEFKSKFPYLAHTWRYVWVESEARREALREGMERRSEELERREKLCEKWANKSGVQEWLSAGGGLGVRRFYGL